MSCEHNSVWISLHRQHICSVCKSWQSHFSSNNPAYCPFITGNILYTSHLFNAVPLSSLHQKRDRAEMCGDSQQLNLAQKIDQFCYRIQWYFKRVTNGPRRTVLTEQNVIVMTQPRISSVNSRASSVSFGGYLW